MFFISAGRAIGIKDARKKKTLSSVIEAWKEGSKTIFSESNSA